MAERKPVSDRVQHHAAHCPAVDFFNALTAPGLFETLEAELPAHRERLFPPTETLSMFLAQALSADGSCRWTVDQAATFRLLSGLPSCSTATGGYCRARARFPTTLIQRLKVGNKVLVTTLADPRRWPKRAIQRLYQRRWDVEINLRHIKTTLGMGVLRCKTPAMAEKEIWVHLLAYNLIRTLMAGSARHTDVLPRQLSFKHTVQLWQSWRCQAPQITDDATLETLFELIAQHRVANRPRRIEPRAVKRRPKPYALLSVPRSDARAFIREHGHPNRKAGENFKSRVASS